MLMFVLLNTTQIAIITHYQNKPTTRENNLIGLAGLQGRQTGKVFPIPNSKIKTQTTYSTQSQSTFPFFPNPLHKLITSPPS